MANKLGKAIALFRESHIFSYRVSARYGQKPLHPEEDVPCFKWNPNEALLDTSKKATTMYNAEHRWVSLDKMEAFIDTKNVFLYFLNIF